MIITDNSSSILLEIPANFTKSSEYYGVELENTVTKKQYFFTNVFDSEHSNSYLYKFNISGSFEPGEYEYRIKNNLFEEVSSGLLRVESKGISRKIVENPVEYTTFETNTEGYTYTQTL